MLRLISLLISFYLFPSSFFLIHADWPMVAANPERTSWCAEEVRGQLKPEWYIPIEPYINYKTQVIASSGKILIATAGGLYAFNAEDGSVEWVYPTELPLGHSPTVANGIAYVGGYDRMIHAVDVNTGQSVSGWNSYYVARAGFETNPLVINGVVYAGNRDGYFYALNAVSGDLQWRFKTDGPILFSAAYKDGVIYFASNDGHAYAVDAISGNQVWKSAKLPGGGFYSYWSVIYKDYVIFNGSTNYRPTGQYSRDVGVPKSHSALFKELFFPGIDVNGTLVGPQETEPGDWAIGTPTVDVSQILEVLEQKPHLRMSFILNRTTGAEFQFDSDGDGTMEYAPIVWAGCKGGTNYPPMVGSDGVLYQPTHMVFTTSIPRQCISGWKFGTPYVSLVAPSKAVDEPVAYSGGGNLIYWLLCCDREGGAFDISMVDGNRSWGYMSYRLHEQAPGYSARYYQNGDLGLRTRYERPAVYGGISGVYGTHGTQNPPVPYNGRVYMQRGNCLMAWSKQGGATALPMAKTQTVTNPSSTFSREDVEQMLQSEIQKIIAAGHLRPGYIPHGRLCVYVQYSLLLDYFHDLSKTYTILLRALPHLTPGLQNQVRTYLQQEFAAFVPTYGHVGWQDGSPREAFDMPQENAERAVTIGPYEGVGVGPGPKYLHFWKYPQPAFYGLWKYAQAFGNAEEIFNQVKSKLESPLPDDTLSRYPDALNGFIAGRIGYLNLQKLAGETVSSGIQNELDHMLALRIATFTKDSPFEVWDVDYKSTFNISRNFMYLVPELAEHLRIHALGKVRAAIQEYQEVAPCWFVSRYDASYWENTFQPLYDYHSLFQAKAMILQDSPEELSRYLDVPAFAQGDLFYIDNLVALLESMNIGPHFIGPFMVKPVPNEDIGFHIRYVLPQGGTPSLEFQKKPGWMNVTVGDSIWGTAPGQIGIVDSLCVVLFVNNVPHDTMVTVITVVDLATVKPEQSGLVLGNALSITSIVPRHQSIQFYITANQEAPFSLSVYNIKGQRLWHHQVQKPLNNITAIDWYREGNPTANITYLSVLQQNSHRAYRRFTIIK